MLAHPGAAAQLIRSGIAGALMQVSNKVLALATSVILARLLGVEGYGAYAFAIALTGMLSTFTELGMAPLALRETARITDPEVRDDRVSAQIRGSARLVGMANGAVILVGVVALTVLPLPLSAIERSTLLISLPLIALAPLTRIGAAFLAGLKRLIESQAFEQVVTPVLVAASALALMFAPQSLVTPETAIACQVLAGSIAVSVLALRLRDYWRRPGIRPEGSKSLALRGWPFLMIGSALTINQQLDTVLVGILLGTEDVGPYRVATQGALLAMFATFVINTIISPFVARYHAEANIEALRRVFFYARLAATVTVGAALLLFLFYGAAVIKLLFGAEFVVATPLLLILTAGYFGNALAGPCGTVLAMTGHERQSAWVLWYTAGINGICALMAGLMFGVTGVAVVTALTVTLYQFWLRYILWREIAV